MTDEGTHSIFHLYDVLCKLNYCYDIHERALHEHFAPSSLSIFRFFCWYLNNFASFVAALLVEGKTEKSFESF